MELTEKQKARFWAKVHKTRKCWWWKGAVNSKGYGYVGFRGKLYGSHCVSYELCIGSAGGKQVLHDCDNRRCVNPAHLFLGTNKDNMNDRDEKGRAANGSRNGNVKLTEEQAIEANTWEKGGKETLTDMAKRFGVSPDCLRQIRRGRTWRHLTL